MDSTSIGFSAVVLGLVELAKRAGLPNKFCYPLAIVLGLVTALLPTSMFGQTILEGLVVALTAVGLYEGGKRLPVVSAMLTRGKLA